jgi:hypothetical protein
MKSVSIGNCRVEFHETHGKYVVIDDFDRILLETRYNGIAIAFRDMYNARGSEMDLETGIWI